MGAQHRSPSRAVPWFPAGLPLSPSQGLCRGLEQGQRWAVSDARRRTGSFPAAGINTPGTSEPAGTPRSPLRGQRTSPTITGTTCEPAGNIHGGLCHCPRPTQGCSGDNPAVAGQCRSCEPPPKVKQPRPRGWAMSPRCFGYSPAEGCGDAAPEPSSAAKERQLQPPRPDTLCPHGTVQSPGLPSSSSSSSSPPLRSQPLALISHV